VSEYRIEETLERMAHALRQILHVLERQEHVLRKIEKELARPQLASSGAVVTTLVP
jgi:hypothetical protein